MAGMRLFAEQGYDDTTVVEIAATAEVSTRSVSAYFPTKMDIATASSDAAADRLTAAFEGRRPGSSSVDVVVEWLKCEPTFVDDEEWRLRTRMFEANPVLKSSGTARIQTLTQAAVEAIADDLQVPIDDYAVQLALGILATVILQYLLLPEAPDAEQITATTIHAALAGALDGIRHARRNI